MHKSTVGCIMDKKKFSALVARRPKEPCKAGLMLYEDTPQGRKLLVSYNEGRFAKNGEYFVLAKGSIDEGETPLHAAMREAKEETGFDIVTFLGKANIATLAAGEPLEHVTNPVYPGVEIVSFSPKAHAHEYHARTGTKQSMVMYGVKVKGLEHLGKLKNDARITTKQYLDAQPELPRFPTFFAWLKQGYIPGETTETNVPLCNAEWFADAIRAHAPNGTIREQGNWEETRRDWQDFCHAIETDKPSYKQLRKSFETIKGHLKKVGYVKGDDALLKFDDKDCPLFWYVEGGHVGYAQDILAKTFCDLRANPDYARAFGGEGTKEKGLKPEETLLRGQIAAYGSFMHASTIRAAMHDALGETGKTASAMISYGNFTRQAAGRSA